MIGAMMQFEMLQAGRRQRVFFLRWIYAAFVLVQIAPIFFMSRHAWIKFLMSLDLYAFFERYLTQHYVFLALLTPAMVAGTITEEKTRGTLQYLLTTNIRPGEIILGKMLAHLCQLAILSLVGLPLLCFFAALANDVAFPVIVLVSSLALVFALAALAMLVSVWCHKTTDAVLCSYLVVGTALFLVPYLALTPWGGWLMALQPLRLLSMTDETLRWQHLGDFLVPWLALGCVLVLLASWRLRRAFRRQLEIVPRSERRWWHGSRKRVHGNPVLWREREVEGFAPVETLRGLPRWLGMVAVMLVSLGTLAYLFERGLPARVRPWLLIQSGDWAGLRAALVPGAGEAFYYHGLAALLVMTLMVALRASSSITGEKERATWYALLLTPLTTDKIIQGKHWGIIWACAPYILAHAAVTIPTAAYLGFEALTWSLVWIGLMVLATVLGSAVGLWCSARAASSWRSLLTTLAVFYLGWLVFIVPIAFVLLVFKAVFGVLLLLMALFADTSGVVAALDSANVIGLGLCIGLAAAFWALTHRLLVAAVQRVGRNDRTMEMDFDYYRVFDEHYRKKEAEWAAERRAEAENRPAVPSPYQWETKAEA